MSLMDKWNQVKEMAEQGKAMYEQAKADGTLDQLKDQAKTVATEVAAEVKNKLQGPKQ